MNNAFFLSLETKMTQKIEEAVEKLDALKLILKEEDEFNLI